MAERTVRQQHGDAGEAIAAGFLVGLGWRVLGRQVRLGRDEVDLVALDTGPPAALVIVEVRSHTTGRFGPPEASIDRGKLARCYRAAGLLRRLGALPDGTRLPALPWRVDVVAVEIGPAAGPPSSARTADDGPADGTRIRHLRAVLPP